MPKITKIEPQKNKQRFNIYTDGKFSFGLDADNFIKSGLRIGGEISEKEIKDLIFKNEFQKLLDKAIRFVSLRPRAEKEIINYLNKKIPPDKQSNFLMAKVMERMEKMEF